MSDKKIEKLVDKVITILLENKGDSVTAFETKLLSYTDYVVLVSGLSELHLKSLMFKCYSSLKEEGMDPINPFKGFANNPWCVLDYGEMVIHFFIPETRSFYDLENFFKHNKLIYPK